MKKTRFVLCLLLSCLVLCSCSAVRGDYVTRSELEDLKNLQTSEPGNEYTVNITTDAEGNYNLSANLYDVWDVAKTKVEIKSKAYLAELTHYYQFWNEDDTEWVYKTQTVAGYFDSKKVSKTLASGDLLIGAKLADLVLAFTPDYASVKIYGIGNEDIDKVDSKTVYKSWNPLYWAY
jgi:hypothetical protein